MSQPDKVVETKKITFEHTCPKCGYTNWTTYNWPIKVYEKMNYTFEAFCTTCNEMYTHAFTEEQKEPEVLVDEDKKEELETEEQKIEEKEEE